MRDAHLLLPRRRYHRLYNYDYSATGAYFVTVCTHGRACLFGHVEGDRVVLNDAGSIVRVEFETTPAIRPCVRLDSLVVMPNHVHAIICLEDSRETTAGAGCPGAGFIRPCSASLGSVIGMVKASCTRKIRTRQLPGPAVMWQKGYYEHVIRDYRSLEQIRQYIADNPAQWALDRENPEYVPPENPPSGAEQWMV